MGLKSLAPSSTQRQYTTPGPPRPGFGHFPRLRRVRQNTRALSLNCQKAELGLEQASEPNLCRVKVRVLRPNVLGCSVRPDHKIGDLHPRTPLG